MHSTQRVLVTLAGVLLMSGCASADVTSPPVTVVAGKYVMTKVNGVSLPTNLSDDKSPIWINSGSLTIESSGAFTSEVTYYRLAGDGLASTSETCSGTYSRTPKGLVFFGPPACNGPNSATVDGSVLTALVNPSISVEYKL